MGKTNDLIVTTVCEHCRKQIDAVIQFKFGGLTQEPYSLGDRISWDFPRGIGVEGSNKVAISGITLECPNCGKEPYKKADVAIIVENDRLAAIDPDAEKFDFPKTGWMVLTE